MGPANTIAVYAGIIAITMMSSLLVIFPKEQRYFSIPDFTTVELTSVVEF